MQGASVTLKVQMGRWRCRSRQCLRQIFTERVDGVLLPRIIKGRPFAVDFEYEAKHYRREHPYGH
jgi:hypothetical protein